MEKRLNQRRAMVGSRTIEAQMQAGRRLQAGYALGNRQKQAEEANALLGRRLVDARVERGGVDPQLWFHLDDGSHRSNEVGFSPMFSLRTTSGSSKSIHSHPHGGGLVHRRRRGPSLPSGSEISRRVETDPSLLGDSGRSGHDSGFLPARK